MYLFIYVFIYLFTLWFNSMMANYKISMSTKCNKKKKCHQNNAQNKAKAYSSA